MNGLTVVYIAKCLGIVDRIITEKEACKQKSKDVLKKGKTTPKRENRKKN